MRRKYNDVLDLVVEHRWYDMIAAGEKNEEYRAHSAYWDRRIGDKIKAGALWSRVRFRRGYTDTSMTFAITQIVNGAGDPRKGAPLDPCWIIRFRPLEDVHRGGR